MFQDKEGYLSRQSSKGVIRNWFLGKERGHILVGRLSLGKKYEGKRIKIKLVVEVLE